MNGGGASTSWSRNWTTTTARTALVCSKLPMVNYTWRLPAAATARYVRPFRSKATKATAPVVAFVAFDLKGRTYLAVANEQDEKRGGNVESVVWAVT